MSGGLSEASAHRDWDARTYDRVADPMHRWGLEVLTRLPLRGDERVLDAGCGSGRVTEALAERLPEGKVTALDASPAMLVEARRRLARFGDRIEYVQADLGQPLPIEGHVDAILSTATFHWVPDHDAMFRNLAAVLGRGPPRRPVRRRGQHRGPATDRPDDRRRLRRAAQLRDAARHRGPPRGGRLPRSRGLAERRAHAVPAGRALEAYLETVCLREHVARLPAAERQAFIRAVTSRMPEAVIDYVRLNIIAVRRA